MKKVFSLTRVYHWFYCVLCMLTRHTTLAYMLTM